MKRKSIVLAAIVVISAMLACNLPSNTPNQPNPNAVLTAAALTVQAQLDCKRAHCIASQHCHVRTISQHANIYAGSAINIHFSTSRYCYHKL